MGSLSKMHRTVSQLNCKSAATRPAGPNCEQSATGLDPLRPKHLSVASEGPKRAIAEHATATAAVTMVPSPTTTRTTLSGFDRISVFTAGRMSRRVGAGLRQVLLHGGALLLAMLATVRVQAQPHILDTTESLGLRNRPTRVKVVAEGNEVSVRIGRSLRKIPLPSASAASLRRIELAVGTAVGLLHVSGESDELILLLSDRAVLWEGHTRLEGDPGEKMQDAIEIADRTGDGIDDVIVGLRHERRRICGQPPALLDPRAVDPKTLELRPVTLRRLPREAEPTEEVVASSKAPTNAVELAATQQPATQQATASLLFFAASSVYGSPRTPLLTPAPTALTDGNIDTVWAEGAPGGGLWEFATARRTVERPIHAIAIVPRPSSERAEQLAYPRSIWLITDDGGLRVRFPNEVLPGQRLWIPLAKPLDTRCLSVVLNESAGSSTHPTAIAEIQAFTDLDTKQGIPTLLIELAGGGLPAAKAADLLRWLGERGIEALLQTWPRMTPEEKGHTLRALGRGIGASAAARRLLVAAAAEELEEVWAPALDALASAQANDELGQIASQPSAAGDRAVELLLRNDAETAAVLLRALGTPRGADRPVLRNAVAVSLRRSRAANQDVEHWLQTNPPISARCALALAVAKGAPSQWALGKELVVSLLDDATDFSDRFRLVQAAGSISSDPRIRRWLITRLREDPVWMIRREAARALDGDPDAKAALRDALRDDPYPRVRAAAALALGRHDAGRDVMATSAKDDRWPMVRAAAIEGLGSRAQTLSIVRGAALDRSPIVRAKAIELLGIANDRSSLGTIRGRLDDAEETPAVLQAALSYVERTCAAEAIPSLVSVAERGFREDAWMDDGRLAHEAVRILGRLGTPNARRALSDLAQRGPDPVKRTARHSLNHSPPCDATTPTQSTRPLAP